MPAKKKYFTEEARVAARRRTVEKYQTNRRRANPEKVFQEQETRRRIKRDRRRTAGVLPQGHPETRAKRIAALKLTLAKPEVKARWRAAMITVNARSDYKAKQKAHLAQARRKGSLLKRARAALKRLKE